jgi:hypothetical protein
MMSRRLCEFRDSQCVDGMTRTEMTKFDCARDEILSLMVNDGWGENDGNVESITGFFSRISNDEDDLLQLIDSFGKEMFEIDPNFDITELFGHFLLEENEMGFVYVTTYPTRRELDFRFNELQTLYVSWEGN